MQKMAARTLQGTVTSQKMNKTITVVVARRTKHPKYGKYISLSTKYHVHDEKEISKEGDIVLIQECKPISKTKNWMLVDVVKKGESERFKLKACLVLQIIVVQWLLCVSNF